MPILRESPEGKKVLANHLAQCFDIFPLYGREPEAADNIRKAFNFQLSEYPIEKITSAFNYHLRFFKEFPVPANIVEIIERGNKPPFERSVYISATKKPAEDRNSDEWAYIREYERFIQRGEY